ncbi:sensor histidine kinase [Thiocystis violascens]|uniref:sensor histidine kinase n=1 Tax=Thiocystis violascens TaxID=73141 RepID=UPI0002DA2047|nr:ATP-binding protein [Thiocystis violascens]
MTVVTDAGLLALIHNAALLLSMVLMFEMLARQGWERSGLSIRILVGVLLGAIGMAVMLTRWELLPGLFFDTRSILLATSGLFFGGVPTLVAMTMTGGFRLVQGGVGAGVGIAVILASGLIGLGWRRWLMRRRLSLAELSLREAYVFGLVVHVAMLLLMLILPLPMALEVLARIGLPVLAIYPLATLLLIVLMAGNLRKSQAETSLRTAQAETMRLLAQAETAKRHLQRLIKDERVARWALSESEARYRALNEVLERRVAERTAELESANRDLASFSYSVSHDLRAPLRAINGFARILARRERERLDEESRHYLDNVVEAGQRMETLIEDLLDYSHTGQGAVRAQPVALGPILASLHSTFGERIAAAGAILEIREPLATPLGDATLIGQILNNLVDNALLYRCREGVPRIVLEARRQDDRVVIGVSDNGIGIDPDDTEKIFQVFQRLHSQEDYPGTGIGLAIVTKAAHRMGGEIGLESVPGQGSRFSVSLAACEEDPYN